LKSIDKTLWHEQKLVLAVRRSLSRNPKPRDRAAARTRSILLPVVMSLRSVIAGKEGNERFTVHLTGQRDGTHSGDVIQDQNVWLGYSS